MKCFICGDPTNHDGVRHSEATGDGLTREHVSQDRTWPVGGTVRHATTCALLVRNATCDCEAKP